MAKASLRKIKQLVISRSRFADWTAEKFWAIILVIL